jgi:O-antigen ligase/tetratricopeptide (TPR) repeat protein
MAKTLPVDKGLQLLALTALGVLILVVDVEATKPFRDGKETFLLVFAGLLSWGLAWGVLRNKVAPGPLRYTLLLFPFAALGCFNLWESLNQSNLLAGQAAGLPRQTSYLMRQYSLALAAIPFGWAAAGLALEKRGASRIGFLLTVICAILALGTGIEMVGQQLGKDWHPFLGKAEVIQGTQELKTHYFASLGNSNFLAGMLAMLFFVSVPWRRDESFSLRLGKGILCVVLFCEILLCRSKGAILGLAFGLLFCGSMSAAMVSNRRKAEGTTLLSRRNRGLVMGVAGALALGLLVLGTVIRSNDALYRQWSETLRLRGESVSQRILLAYTGLEMWKTSPWTGIGPGQFRIRFLPEISRLLETEEGELFRERVDRLKSFRPVNIHNDYLQILVEWGVLGYVSFLAFLAAVLGAGWREGISLSGVSGFRRSCISGAVAGLGYALFEFPMHLPPHLALLAFLLGVGLAIGPSPARPSRSLLVRIPLSILALLLGVFLQVQGWGIGIASHIGTEARVALSESETAQRQLTARFRQAQSLDPGNSEWDLQLARLEWKLENNPTRAIKTLREGAAISDDPSFSLLEALIAVEQGKWNDAVYALKPLRSVGGYLPGVGYVEGRIAEARGDTGAALQAYGRDLRALANFPPELRESLHPDLFRLRLRYGTLLEEAERYPEAIEQYRELSEMPSDIPLGLIRLGTLYRDRVQDYPSARRILEQALDRAEKTAPSSEVQRIQSELEKVRHLERETRIEMPVLREG